MENEENPHDPNELLERISFDEWTTDALQDEDDARRTARWNRNAKLAQHRQDATARARNAGLSNNRPRPRNLDGEFAAAEDHIYIDFFMKLSSYGSAETDFVVDRTAWNSDLLFRCKIQNSKTITSNENLNLDEMKN